jgi:hypothetical protein
MKIAISGAHGTGKTTLATELARRLPGYALLEEPYFQLVEEGHVFAEMPSLEDFELQLERSIETILESDGDVVFDRCPADFLAYLTTHDDALAFAFEVEAWLPRAREAMQQLDIVIFVPIEQPDRIADPGDFTGLRVQVDDELRDTVLRDRWGFGNIAIEASGTLAERVGQVLAHIVR